MPSQDGQTRPAVISLAGSLEYASARQARERLTTALAAGPSALIIDLSATEFCDTAGFAELGFAHRLAGARGTRIHLVVPAGDLTRLFEVHGLCGVWHLYPTLDAAVAATTAAPGDPAPAT